MQTLAPDHETNTQARSAGDWQHSLFCSSTFDFSGLFIVATSLLRSDFDKVFDTNGKRGIVGNAFGVCAVSLIGAIEAYAQVNSISRVDYFFEAGGPGQATIDRIAAES